MTIETQFRGTAAMPALPPWHWQHKVHGLTVDVAITIEFDSSAEATLQQPALTKRLQDWMDSSLAGRHVNDVTGLHNPDLNLIAQWLFEQLEQQFPGLAALQVSTPHDPGLEISYRPGEGARPHRR